MLILPFPSLIQDAELLYEAKYGKRENGKMTREQYGALRRKIGGTYSDFLKEVSLKIGGRIRGNSWTGKGLAHISPPQFPPRVRSGSRRRGWRTLTTSLRTPVALFPT